MDPNSQQPIDLLAELLRAHHRLIDLVASRQEIAPKPPGRAPEPQPSGRLILLRSA